jgi:hypothetical protein
MFQEKILELIAESYPFFFKDPSQIILKADTQRENEPNEG